MSFSMHHIKSTLLPEPYRNAPRKMPVAATLLLATALSGFAPAANAQTAPADPPHKTYGKGDDVADAALAKKPKVGRYRGYLRVAVDLSNSLPPIGDQGTSDTGVAWAIAYTARGYYAATREGRNVQAPQNQPSPSYIYNLARHDACHDDVTISDVIDVLRIGSLSLAQSPYKAECLPPAPPAVVAEAKDFKVEDLRVIDRSHIDDIKGQIERGNPVIVSFQVSNAFEDLRGPRVFDEPEAPRAGKVQWQTLTVVGYDDERQAVRVTNSWGRGWADQGYAWIAYGTLTNRISAAFVLDLGAQKPDEAKKDDVKKDEPKKEEAKKDPAKKDESKKTADKSDLIDDPDQASNDDAVDEDTHPKPKDPDPTKDENPGPVSPKKLKSLASLVCGKVKRTSDHGGAILTGFVASDQDLESVKALAAKEPNTKVGEIQVAPWPLCEALDTLDKALAAPDKPQLTMSPDGAAKEGDTLEIDLHTPVRPSYVYMSYFQADRTVVTMVQPKGVVPQPFPSDDKFKFGDGKDGRPKFTVSAPYGNEMVVVVSSASPLFSSEMPQQQSERDYLSTLRKALIYKPAPNMPNREVAAAIRILKTSSR